MARCGDSRSGGRYPARPGEGEHEPADAGHAGIAEEKGPGRVDLSGPERLGDAGRVAALRPAGRPRPGAGQEVMAALDEPQADADQHQRDEHRGRGLRDR
jgi:hypothetical protein